MRRGLAELDDEIARGGGPFGVGRGVGALDLRNRRPSSSSAGRLLRARCAARATSAATRRAATFDADALPVSQSAAADAAAMADVGVGAAGDCATLSTRGSTKAGASADASDNFKIALAAVSETDGTSESAVSSASSTESDGFGLMEEEEEAEEADRALGRAAVVFISRPAGARVRLCK